MHVNFCIKRLVDDIVNDHINYNNFAFLRWILFKIPKESETKSTQNLTFLYYYYITISIPINANVRNGQLHKNLIREQKHGK